MSRRVGASFLLVTALVVAVPAPAQSTVAAPGSPSTDRASIPGPSGPDNADFNGDGFGDLAVSAPQMAVGDHDQAGGVFVLLGTATGLSGRDSQFLSNATPGVPGKLSAWLGLELSWGDYDADGYDDLAVSAPYGGARGRPGGYVMVFPGSAGGLTGAGSVRWSFYSKEMPGGHDGGLLFGQTVLSADVDSDGFDDLVIGVPRGSVGKFVGGSGRVLYGSSGGLGKGRPGSVIRPRTEMVSSSDYFGTAMAAGDFDGDGYLDVAVGAPQRGSVGEAAVGQVWIFGGGPEGLSGRPVQGWGADSEDLDDPPGPYHHWGSFLSAGDLDGDGVDDLAVTAGADGGGYVRVLFGTDDGLTGEGSQHWDKQTPGLPIEPAPTSGFGDETLIADITGDGDDDLLISHTADAVDGAYGGSFLVLPGTRRGPVVEGVERWNQNSPGISEDAESLEYFGSELVASDVNGDGRLDVITSTPRESVGDVDAAGIVQMFLRSADGSGFDEDWPISRLSPGLRGDPTYPDGFGLRLAG